MRNRMVIFTFFRFLMFRVFFLTYVVFILLVWPRLRDSPILLIASREGTIVTNIINKCTISDWKLYEKYRGNIHILVHSLSRALFEFLCTNSISLCSLSCLWLFQYNPFYEVRRNIKGGKNSNKQKNKK